MTIDQLKQVHQARPFRPFTIHLADGRSFLIPHNEFLSHSPVGRTLIVYGKSRDDFNILDLLLVTGLEVHESEPEQDAA